MTGVGAAHRRVAIDQDDTTLILRLWDEAPGGARRLVTTGFLEASHREPDERTGEGNPRHSRSRRLPVEPGVITEYVIRIYPFAAAFRPGRRLVVALMWSEPPVDDHNALLPPVAFHLPVGRPVTHIVYRDAGHPSRILLPFVRREDRRAHSGRSSGVLLLVLKLPGGLFLGISTSTGAGGIGAAGRRPSRSCSAGWRCASSAPR